MKTFASRLAALWLAALVLLLCSPAFAATVFDNLGASGLNNWFSGSAWRANRLPVGADPVRIQSVALQVQYPNTVGIKVCRDNAAGNGPAMGTCATFATDNPNGLGLRSFTGSYSAAANETVWVVMWSDSGNTSALQFLGLSAWDGAGWSSSDGGADWTPDRNASYGMTVTGAIALPPVIGALTPSQGPQAGGTPVVIRGRALDTVQAVTFAGMAAPFTVQGDGQITATTPASPQATAELKLTNAFGSSTASYQYLNAPAPAVLAVQPPQGPLAGADVVIAGTDFRGVTGVYFGPAGQRTPAASYTVLASDRIAARAPAAATAGSAPVWVDTAYGAASAAFAYLAPPSLGGIAPGQGSAAGGTQITLQGTALAATTAVRVGGAAAPFSVDSDTQLRATTPPGVAGYADVALDTPGGTATLAGGFLYLAPATLTGVWPPTTSTQGGRSVTLVGSGFTGASAVTFGGVNAASFTVFGDTQINATTPAMPAGPVPIVVTAPAGSATGSITVQAPPAITNLAPPSGPTTAGGHVTAVGTGFSGATAVTFGGVPAASYTVLGDTYISITVPAHVAAMVPLQVTTPGGTASATYTFMPPAPTLSAVSPASGPLAGGTQVVLTGQNLLSALTVFFGNAPATNLRLGSDTQVTVTAPAGMMLGDVAITLTTLGGSATAPQPFTYLGPPLLTRATPASGPTAGGTQVVLSGLSLLGTSQVSFDNQPAASFHVDSNTQITAPAHAAGAVAVGVVTPRGNTAWGYFRYMDAPAITGISPAQGPAAGGMPVTLSGSGLTDASAVTFDGLQGTGLSVASDGSLSVTPPAHALGAVDVRVVAPGGSATAAQAYTYVAAPAVTGLQPASGPANASATVVLTGSRFSGATGVLFGTAPATFTVNSDQQITATAPALPVGSVAVQVLGPGGVGQAPSSYWYAPVPRLTTSYPAQGALGGGARVTLIGSGLTGASAVRFGTVAAPSFHVVDDTTITTTSPPGTALGSVAIQVQTPGGTAAGGSFRYVAPPTVTGVSPGSGPVSGRYDVTITGTGFAGDTTAVYFGGARALPVEVQSDTQLIAVAPRSASGGTVQVKVLADGGTSMETGAGASFTYIAVPTLTAISPTTAAAAGGTRVAISGTGLTGATAVTFGGVAATAVSVDSDTRITATAPAHAAGSVDVAVTTPGGTATRTGGLAYAALVDGACGTPAASLAAPTTGLCSAGQASSVQSSSGQYTWTCAGTQGGADSGQCSAPWATLGATRTAIALPDAAQNNGWTLASAGAAALPAPLPQGANSMFTPLALALQGGTTGTGAQVTVRYGQPVPPGAVYLKYGPSPAGLNCAGAACAQPHWYPLPGAAFAPDGLSVSFTLTDGGAGDSDSVPGQITDPGLPVLLAAAPGGGATPVPGLGPWALALLSLLACLAAGLWALSRN